MVEQYKKRKTDKKMVLRTTKRVLGYMLKNYKFRFALVVLCILITALATLSGNLFAQRLIDDYIVPMTQSASPDFGPLAHALMQMPYGQY